MCNIVITDNMLLDNTWHGLVVNLSALFDQAVMKELDHHLIPRGYTRQENSIIYHSDKTSLDINYVGDGFIYGYLYPKGEGRKDQYINVGIFQEKGKADARTIAQFITILDEKEKEIDW